MGFLSNVTRRTVMAGQAAAATLAALPSMTSASATTTDTIGDAGEPLMPARWDTATARELAPHVGDRFRVHTEEHGTLVLKLVALEPGAEDLDRPDHLARRAGVTAVFDSPDMAPLVADGHGLHRVHHPRIGAADLYMVASPRRHGGSFVEVVLN